MTMTRRSSTPSLYSAGNPMHKTLTSFYKKSVEMQRIQEENNRLQSRVQAQ